MQGAYEINRAYCWKDEGSREKINNGRREKSATHQIKAITDKKAKKIIEILSRAPFSRLVPLCKETRKGKQTNERWNTRASSFEELKLVCNSNSWNQQLTSIRANIVIKRKDLWDGTWRTFRFEECWEKFRTKIVWIKCWKFEGYVRKKQTQNAKYEGGIWKS